MNYLADDHRIHAVIETCQSIFSHPLHKLVAAGVLATFSFFFGDLVVMSLIGLGVLVVFDLITGLQAARQSDEEFILSRMIVTTGIKAGTYMIFISSASIVEWSIPQIPENLELINEGIIGAFILSEFFSIMENAKKMGYSLPARILDFIQNNKK